MSMDFKLKIFDHCVFEKVNPPLAYTDVSFGERENGSNGSVVRAPGFGSQLDLLSLSPKLTSSLSQTELPTSNVYIIT